MKLPQLFPLLLLLSPLFPSPHSSFSSSSSSLVSAASASDWSSRTIYQIVTDRFAVDDDAQARPCDNLKDYCGGTFKGINNHLDYIQGMGFDAIWLGPVVENFDSEYHGYAAKNLYNINKHFGGSEELTALIKAAHNRSMYVMVGVVGNHMGIPPGYDFSSIVPFNSPSHYHSCSLCSPSSGCNIVNFGNQSEVELCRLSGLPDLDQDVPEVRETLKQWVRDLVRNYSIDGLRVDTIPEVRADFWAEFQEAAGVYAVGECFNGDINYVAPYQLAIDGLLSYPLYFTLRAVFQQRQSMKQIETMTQAYQQKFKDINVLGTFVDNHDNPRFLNSQSDVALYKSALAYVLLSTGIPIIYYGTEQLYNGGNDPYCREPLWTSKYSTSSEMYLFLKTVITARKSFLLSSSSPLPQIQRYSDDSFYAFSRGSLFVALTNAGSNGGVVSRSISYHPYKVGDTVCNVFWPSGPTADCVTVTTANTFTVTLNAGEVKVYTPPIVVPTQTLYDTVVARANVDTSIISSILATDSRYVTFKERLQSTTTTTTFFVPSDVAMRKANINADQASLLLASLNFHSLPRSLSSSSLSPQQFTSSLLTDPQYVNDGPAGTPAYIEITMSGGVNAKIQLIGGVPNVNVSTVTVKDVSCTNGYLHVVDTLLLPPSTVTSTAFSSASLLSLSSFLATVNEFVDMPPKFDDTTAVTVFAPTDAAFANAQFAGASTATVLTSHIVPGIYFSSSLYDGQRLTTLNGVTLLVSNKNSVLTVGGSPLVTRDILTKNGVMHTVSNVLSIPSKSNTVLNNVFSSSSLSYLASYLSQPALSTLSAALSSTTPVTLFAPSNQALMNIRHIPSSSSSSSSSLTPLAATLSYHVLNGRFDSHALAPTPTSTIDNSVLFFSTLLPANDPAYVQYDATKPYALLQVEAAQGTGKTTIRTVFGEPSLNFSTVTIPDIICTNGYIHFIDSMMSLPSSPSSTLLSSSSSSSSSSSTSLSTLLSTLSSLSLSSLLDSTAGFTLFAPSDGAFLNASLSALATMSGDLSEESKAIKCHVVQGVYTTKDLKNNTLLPTLCGVSLSVRLFSLSNGVTIITVNGASLLLSSSNVNYMTNRGVIHVIDTVLFVPNNKNTITDNIALIPQLTSMHALLQTPAFYYLWQKLSNTSYNANNNNNQKGYTFFTVNNNALTRVSSSLTPSLLNYHVVNDVVYTSSFTSSSYNNYNKRKNNNNNYNDGDDDNEETFHERVSDVSVVNNEFMSTLLDGPINITNLGARGHALLHALMRTPSPLTHPLFSLSWGRPDIDVVNITVTDVPCVNGVVHIIDRALETPRETTKTLQSFNNSGSLSPEPLSLLSFIRLLDLSQLTSVINSLSGITIFAPIDSALSALNNNNNNNNNNMITNLLDLHIVHGVYTSVDLLNLHGQRLSTLQQTQGGDSSSSYNSVDVSVHVVTDSQGVELTVTVGGADILMSDILTKNAIVHIVDRVLIPSSAACMYIVHFCIQSMSLLLVIVLMFMFSP